MPGRVSYSYPLRIETMLTISTVSKAQHLTKTAASFLVPAGVLFQIYTAYRSEASTHSMFKQYQEDNGEKFKRLESYHQEHRERFIRLEDKVDRLDDSVGRNTLVRYILSRRLN